jgi:hypothetical protein
VAGWVGGSDLVAANFGGLLGVARNLTQLAPENRTSAVGKTQAEGGPSCVWWAWQLGSEGVVAIHSTRHLKSNACTHFYLSLCHHHKLSSRTCVNHFL